MTQHLRDQRSEIRGQRSATASVEPGARRDGERGGTDDREGPGGIAARQSRVTNQQSAISIALLTGGGDKPYALGMAEALTAAGISIDFIGSNDLNVPELINNSRVRFLNLRGDQQVEASVPAKMLRVLRYYVKLIAYAATAKPKLFHLLWNNKFRFFDRTVLMLYYRLLGKKIIFTAHNVNAGKRDLNDSWLNRRSLKVQYNLSDHIFVHTDGMKTELVADFDISEEKVSVIPFGINNTVPNTSLSGAEARRQLGIDKDERALLFFGNIAAYKGLEYLVLALTELLNRDENYRLIIVGKPKGSEEYWKQIQATIAGSCIRDRVIEVIEYVPDEATELYFKAADVLILPYAQVFQSQSGVLLLGYSFGLPAIAADVGTLREDIAEEETGFVFNPRDSSDLASKIDKYFKSELFHKLENRRAKIKAYANERYSWSRVAKITTRVYAEVLPSTRVGDQRSEVRPSSRNT
jgi:D-inositol-3-phosphate glycosyltransferase